MSERDTVMATAIVPTLADGSSARTAAHAAQVLQGRSRRRGLARILPFLGPAFIACVAYIDPGNFATNIVGGAQYGYLLVWVIIASNLMAMLVQALSAKLGIATGHNLAEICRERFPRPVVLGLWGLMEVVAMATDLAEFLGAAIGFNLLFGIPLFAAGILTAIATFVILALERYGFRRLEAVIGALVGVIAVAYVLETLMGKPDFAAVGRSFLPPRLADTNSLLLAVGILGATVMPHVIFLHSALTQHRIRPQGDAEAQRLFRFETIDVLIAMGLAGFVNAAMLMMAAATFFANGLTDVNAIEQAYRTLQPVLGQAASTIFAISLLASGLSASTVGTMAGQVMMQGFIRRTIPVWIRRLVTMTPALVVIAVGLEPTQTLIISQVFLSFGIPFALVPLVIFTQRRDLMGTLVNRRSTTILTGCVAALIIALNIFLLKQTFLGG